ncbi:MAG: cell shape determination protein CcmA [Ignavibacteriales bacterium CG12_big_fil_rev_8_21_14_0_65_30_8]|nr:MAG: cell shape determination protein CcmA [Ignavibacteriales bacterium CG12_big_fil_rev_8_21_14_0_65_30_8]
MKCNGNIRVDGAIHGDIDAVGNITIGSSGKVKGEITAKDITIGGKVDGIVRAENKVVLEAKSMLRGELNTKILVIAEGAIFDGTSKMMSNEKIPIKTPQTLNVK